MHPDHSTSPQDWQRDGYTVTTRQDRMDVDAIQAYLAQSYWATGIDRATVEQAMRHSLCFGLFHYDRQIGYARLVTDTVRFAYLMDVYVLEPYQGQGLGQWLIQCVLDHPQINGLRRVLLTTLDAQEFYRKLGFVELDHPERWMQIFRPKAT